MCWDLFWTAFGAIGASLGAVATTLAVIVALWQTKYTHKKKLKIYFIDNFQLYNQNTGASVKYIGVRVTNIGNRKLIIQNWGLHMKKGDVIILKPTEAGRFERLAYADLPRTLDLEEFIDLQLQIDRFKTFLQENKDNLDINKPLVFLLGIAQVKIIVSKQKIRRKNISNLFFMTNYH